MLYFIASSKIPTLASSTNNKDYFDFHSHIDTIFLFSETMKLVLLCLIFFGFCQNAQCQNNPFSGLTKVQVPKGGAKSLSFEVVAKGNVTSHIEIKAKIIQGKAVEGLGTI